MWRCFLARGIIKPFVGSRRATSVEPPFVQFAVVTWANDEEHSSTPTGQCRRIAPLYPPKPSRPVQCGKPDLNPDHRSQHNGPEGVYLTAWVTDRGFVLSPFFFPPSFDQRLNPLNQIFSFSLNNGHSHVNTRGFIHSARSQRWPDHPRVFVPQLKELNWEAIEGGLEGYEGS